MSKKNGTKAAAPAAMTAAELLGALHDRADPDARSLALTNYPGDDADAAKAATYVESLRKAIELGQRNRNARIDVKCVREAFGLPSE